MKKYFGIIICMLFISTANVKVLAQTVNDTVKTAVIKVNGVGCNGDMPVIKKKLINMEGIDEVSYTMPKKGIVTFAVTYHTAFITDQQIRTAIETSPCCDDPESFPFKIKSFISEIKPLK